MLSTVGSLTHTFFRKFKVVETRFFVCLGHEKNCGEPYFLRTYVFFESPNIPMHLKGSSIWKVQFKNEHVYRTPKSPCARWQQISDSFFITLALVSFAYSTNFVRICDCKKQKKVASFRHDLILKTRWSGRNLKCARGNWTGMHCTRALFFEPSAHRTQQ